MGGPCIANQAISVATATDNAFKRRSQGSRSLVGRFPGGVGVVSGSGTSRT